MQTIKRLAGNGWSDKIMRNFERVELVFTLSLLDDEFHPTKPMKNSQLSSEKKLECVKSN
jgi:hypothetical protein